MNSRSWRNDELGQLIRHALYETVADAEPSPQAWHNIKRRLAEQGSDVSCRPRRWPRVAMPSLQASLTLVFLLILGSTLTWDMAPRHDHLTVEPTASVATSASSAVVTIEDHPSEPSPIVVRARDIAVRRALASAVHPGVFAGTLERSSGRRVSRQETTPAQRIGLARARD